MIEAVLFDFGGTLADQGIFLSSARDSAIKAILKFYNRQRNLIPELRKQYHKISKKVWIKHQKTSPRLKERKAREELFYRLIVQIGEVPHPEAIKEAFHGLVEGAVNSNCIYPNTPIVLNTLRDRYHLAIVSNGLAAYTWDCLKYNGLLSFFSVKIISEETGLEKPDPKVFWRALEKLKVDSSKAIMVGNMLWEDILGAKSAGIRSIWINNNEPQRKVTVHPDFKITEIGEVIEVIAESENLPPLCFQQGVKRI